MGQAHVEGAGDRRQRPRLQLSLRASIRRRGGARRWDVQTENINCGGVSFRSAESFRLGEVLEICLDLGGFLGAGLAPNTLLCLGKVIRSEVDDPKAPFRYGCEILDYTVSPN